MCFVEMKGAQAGFGELLELRTCTCRRVAERDLCEWQLLTKGVSIRNVVKKAEGGVELEEECCCRRMTGQKLRVSLRQEGRRSNFLTFASGVWGDERGLPERPSCTTCFRTFRLLLCLQERECCRLVSGVEVCTNARE